MQEKTQNRHAHCSHRMGSSTAVRIRGSIIGVFGIDISRYRRHGVVALVLSSRRDALSGLSLLLV